LRADTRMTRRWGHDELHDHLTPLKGNVIMTYYGAAQPIVWARGKERLTSRTSPGSITLIPDGHEGRWDIDGPIEVSHVYLSDARLQACADELAGGRRVDLMARVGFDDPTTSRILQLLSQENVADPGSLMFVEQAIDLLCTQLVRAHSSEAAAAETAPRRGLADWQVKRVTGYMGERLDQEISLDELAGLVSLSRFHFCTAFRLATGQTPHNWLTAMRMARARALLADLTISVTEVALAVGYQTPSAFTAAFRRFSNLTPREYRRSL
ncbi:MAG: AraC family transcriptional regulator, partial [Caulobacter sp.]